MFGILTSTPRLTIIQRMEYFYRELGRSIRQAREAVGLTQEELAQRVDLSRASVANIERGNQGVALHKFLELSQALGIDPMRLLPRLEGRGARLGHIVQQAGYPEELASWGARAIERIVIEDLDNETEHAGTGGRTDTGRERS